MNILLTCAGRRHYLARYFHDALAGRGLLIGADMDPTAPALTACDKAYQVPAVFASDYLERIIQIIRRENIGMVFSLNDLEIGLLADRRDEIEAATGAVLYIPSPETLKICADKWETFRFARDLGLPAIPTFLSPEAALDAVSDRAAALPMIVKPRWGSASIGIERVTEQNELRPAFERCLRAVSDSALASLGQEDSVIIQKMIVGPEYGVDILFGADEKCQGFAAKRKLSMRSGETDKAVTVQPEPFEKVVSAIASKLQHRGNLDCDFLEKDGVLYLLEMNPRFGGGYPFTHESGGDHVMRLIQEALRLPLPEYSYHRGRAFAKCDILVPVPPPSH